MNVYTEHQEQFDRAPDAAAMTHMFRVDPKAAPDHDYDPAWDYDIADAADELLPVIREAGERMVAEILPVFGFFGFVLFDALLPGDCVGIYISGTAPFPVVGLDTERMAFVAREEGLDLASEIAVSIAHELAHAHQDMCGLLHDDPHSHDTEDAAEAFARCWHQTGIVDVLSLETTP